MMATVRALDMSIRNAMDVLSMSQVAESAINEHSKLYKELENYQFKQQLIF